MDFFTKGVFYGTAHTYLNFLSWFWPKIYQYFPQIRGRGLIKVFLNWEANNSFSGHPTHSHYSIVDWCVRVDRGTPGRVQYDWGWGVTVYECQNWILGPTPWVMLKKYSALTLTFTPLLCLFLQSTQAASSKNGKAKYLNSNIFIHSIILLIAWIFNFYISFLSSILKTISSNQNSFYNMRTFKSVSFKFQA